MATLRFTPKKKTNGTCHIMAVIQDGPSEYSRYTGYSIPDASITVKGKKELKYWNANSSRVRSLDPDETAEINKLLADWETAFKAYISACNINQQPIDVIKFRDSLGKVNQTLVQVRHKSSPLLVDIIEQYLQAIASTHKDRTSSKFTVLKANILKYQEARGTTIHVSDVDHDFYMDFCKWCISSENNFNPTLNKKQGNIVTVLTYAQKHFKLPLTNQYLNIHRWKETAAKKYALHPEELATLRAFTPTNTYHAMVLDAFLLATETGLRHSDIIQLKAAHIKTRVTTSGTFQYIDITAFKGDKNTSVPVSNLASQVIEKYYHPTDCLFHFDYSQSTSRTLKSIFEHPDVNLNRPCEIVQIQGVQRVREVLPLHDVISFHMGRNTYITRLLAGGVPAAYVKDNAAHSDLKTTEGYYRDSDTSRFQETLRILNS
ncbi:MAG: tyrosine-type recombinase/integrase [Taibaiella sp.]|nr:tyrosine-type recombinase/integrase [Taibaiella sp.]